MDLIFRSIISMSYIDFQCVLNVEEEEERPQKVSAFMLKVFQLKSLTYKLPLSALALTLCVVCIDSDYYNIIRRLMRS